MANPNSAAPANPASSTSPMPNAGAAASRGGWWRTYGQVFASRQVGAMLLLGFSSGLPLALTAGALQAWLTVEGISIKTIGYFALVGLPYTFKFVWAPLLDRFEPRWLGRRRAWIFVFQVLLAIACFLMARFDPASSISTMAVLAVAIAFLSASQDIVFDAYRADLLSAEERGAGAAVSVLGYRLAMLVSGGAALIIADQWLGWPATYRLMGGLMLLLAAMTLFCPRVPDAQRLLSSARAEWLGFVVMVAVGAAAWFGLSQALRWLPLDGASRFTVLGLETATMVLTGLAAIYAARMVGFPSFLAPWEAFFSRKHALWLLMLIVLYKLGDAFAGSLTTSFLLRGVGFTQTEVGAINKGLGLVATIVGALAGGAWLSNRPLYNALMLFGILQAVSNFGYWLLAVLPKSYGLMAAAIGIENLCGGLGTAAFVAFLMALTDRRYSAAQYALLSALAAVGRVYVGPASGVMVDSFGWPTFFMLTVITALPGLLLLWCLRADVRALGSVRLGAAIDD
jgi:PAT family beta-lactamase induction signal transducer AmpG